MKKYIYLAGPILGCTEGEANDWRRDLATRLAEHNIVGISPLRCEPLHGATYGSGSNDPRFGTPTAIHSKNLMDVQSCDMTLAYLPEPPAHKDQSWGTISELGWAFALSKPRVVVTNHAKVRAHPVIAASAGFGFLDDFDQAFDLIIGLFDGYCGGKNV